VIGSSVARAQRTAMLRSRRSAHLQVRLANDAAVSVCPAAGRAVTTIMRVRCVHAAQDARLPRKRYFGYRFAKTALLCKMPARLRRKT
jgi:hypothetical protein